MYNYTDYNWTLFIHTKSFTHSEPDETINIYIPEKYSEQDENITDSRSEPEKTITIQIVASIFH